MQDQRARHSKLLEFQTFIREFRENFETTGSVLPSSRFLARAITRFATRPEGPATLLEAGPGTGPFTHALVKRLRPGDRLVLVELNGRFVDILSRKLEQDPHWQSKRQQVEIIHGPAQDLPDHYRFHAIVCGLPFNNFDPEVVDQLFSLFIDRLEDQGTYSFFEYLWIRKVKSGFVGRGERARLAEVGKTLAKYRQQFGIGSNVVPLNVPPAVVHHLQKKTTHACGRKPY